MPCRACCCGSASRSTPWANTCDERQNGGGCFGDFEKGISLGCPPSALIGAFFLTGDHDALEKTGLFYTRFLADILAVAPSLWKRRRAIRTVNQVEASLAVEKHPDKTFIGRIARGYDFLWYHFSRAGLMVAHKTIASFIKKASRLYEQKRSTGMAAAAPEMYIISPLFGLHSNTASFRDTTVRCSLKPYFVCVSMFFRQLLDSSAYCRNRSQRTIAVAR
jgi:hypothetical protein